MQPAWARAHTAQHERPVHFDGATTCAHGRVRAGTYQYFLKVVPTSYTSLRNQTTQSSQYSVTEHYKPLTMESMLNSGSAPGVLFNYDLSAIKVRGVCLKQMVLSCWTYSVKCMPQTLSIVPVNTKMAVHHSALSECIYMRLHQLAALVQRAKARSPCAIVFLYAVQVNVIEARTSFLHFLTNVCAIVGGVFTVSGILDSTLYHGQKLIRKKMELGKYG